MKKYLNIRFLTAMILSLSIMFSVTSCEEKEPVEDRPDLPPIESLVMDFSNFVDEPAGNKGAPLSINNVWYSYWTVWGANVIAGIVSVIPATAYTVALQQTPVYVGDYTWEWSFDFTLDKEYTATLTGARLNNAEFSMEMKIALAATPNLGVKWFDGVVRYDHTHAEWILYENGLQDVLEVEWNMNYETGMGDLTYTYTKPGEELTDSFIKAEHRPGEFFDAAYTISVPEGLTNIEWNIETKEGHVKAPVHFGDNEWHCWDSQANGLVDKVCDQ